MTGLVHGACGRLRLMHKVPDETEVPVNVVGPVPGDGVFQLIGISLVLGGEGRDFGIDRPRIVALGVGDFHLDVEPCPVTSTTQPNMRTAVSDDCQADSTNARPARSKPLAWLAACSSAKRRLPSTQSLKPVDVQAIDPPKLQAGVETVADVKRSLV